MFDSCRVPSCSSNASLVTMAFSVHGAGIMSILPVVTASFETNWLSPILKNSKGLFFFENVIHMMILGLRFYTWN